jgi:hypothetical protein
MGLPGLLSEAQMFETYIGSNSFREFEPPLKVGQRGRLVER